MLAKPKGVTNYGPLGQGQEPKTCLDFGLDVGDDFDDCWGLDELIPESSECAVRDSCRTFDLGLVSQEECNALCLPLEDTESWGPDGICCAPLIPGECPCSCIPGGRSIVNIFLLSPTELYYDWGEGRVLATLTRQCPQNNTESCTLACPYDSANYDLCLEFCQTLCPPDIMIAATNTRELGDGDIAGIFMAGALATLVIVVAAHRLKKAIVVQQVDGPAALAPSHKPCTAPYVKI